MHYAPSLSVHLLLVWVSLGCQAEWKDYCHFRMLALGKDFRLRLIQLVCVMDEKEGSARELMSSLKVT